MEALLSLNSTTAGRSAQFAPHQAPEARGPATVERLPFTVRVVRQEQQLYKAISIRQRAYGRHIPSLGEMLRAPEALDHDPDSVVLLAESRLDGEPLGTMRIQTNRSRPLTLESSVELPEWLQGRSLAEATRLGVTEGRIGRVVKTMLFKAFYQYCIAADIDWLVIGARSPLDRMYQALLFQEVFPGQGYIPLKHAGNLPHRILGFEMETAEARWREAKHPLFDLFVNTIHPDIERSTAVPARVAMRRQPTAPVALAA
jgi:hypothetical protein